MKKNVAIIIVIIFITGLFFNACQKEQVNNTTDNQVVDLTEQKILDFKNKVENGIKSDEELTTQDAVWYIEALANYDYCKFTEEKLKVDLNAIYIDSLFIEQEISNNQLPCSEAINIYQTIEEKIVSTFNKFESEIKFYDLVDVEYIENGFKVYYTFTYNVVCEKGDCYSVSQDWYWGFDLGKLDGTCVGKDARDVLYAQINATVGYPANTYFTDVDYFWERADYFPTQNNPYGNYLMYQELIPDIQTNSWLPSYEMSYYFTGTKQALNIMRNTIPANHIFKSWLLYDFRGQIGYALYTGHSIRIWYGIGHNIPPAN